MGSVPIAERNKVLPLPELSCISSLPGFESWQQHAWMSPGTCGQAMVHAEAYMVRQWFMWSGSGLFRGVYGKAVGYVVRQWFI